MAPAATLKMARDRFGRETEVYEWILGADEIGDSVHIAARRNEKLLQVLLGSSNLDGAAVAWKGTASDAAAPPALDFEPVTDGQHAAITHLNNGREVLQDFLQFRPETTGGTGATQAVCRLVVAGKA